MPDSFTLLINKERQAQDEKWGEQNHHPGFWYLILAEEFGELGRAILEHLEDPLIGNVPTEKELIQVAAVAKAMFESGKRNGWL